MVVFVLYSHDTDELLIFESSIDCQFVHVLIIENGTLKGFQPFIVKVSLPAMQIYFEL